MRVRVLDSDHAPEPPAERQTVYWRFLEQPPILVYEDEVPLLINDALLCGDVFVAEDALGICARISPGRVSPA